MDDLIAKAKACADDHETIWLEAKCREDNGREWCQDDVWGDDCDCDEGGHPPTKYIRADLATAAATAQAEVIDRLLMERDAATDSTTQCLEQIAALVERAEKAEAENKRLVEECDELHFTFDLRWKADMRAIKRWQEAHPGNDLVWPDHADLVVWMLEQRS